MRSSIIYYSKYIYQLQLSLASSVGWTTSNISTLFTWFTYLHVYHSSHIFIALIGSSIYNTTSIGDYLFIEACDC